MNLRIHLSAAQSSHGGLRCSSGSYPSLQMAALHTDPYLEHSHTCCLGSASCSPTDLKRLALHLLPGTSGIVHHCNQLLRWFSIQLWAGRRRDMDALRLAQIRALSRETATNRPSYALLRIKIFSPGR
jgi:hypothetical protein